MTGLHWAMAALAVFDACTLVGLWWWMQRRLKLLGADHHVIAHEQANLRQHQARLLNDGKTLARIDMDLSDVVAELRAMRGLLEVMAAKAEEPA